jgi:hypothetical protein
LELLLLLRNDRFLLASAAFTVASPLVLAFLVGLVLRSVPS